MVPNFGPRPVSHQTTFRDERGEVIDTTLEPSDEERVTRFGLNGRATSLFPVQGRALPNQKDDLVAKVFWEEATRMSEPDILQRVYDIAKDNADVEGHVPEMLWYKVSEATSTAKIRERLGLKTQGARVRCMIIFRKLSPVTELVGDSFLHAWWATVKCHLALWKNGVYHRDISPSNLMYRKDKEKGIMGVLSDFDLASTKEIPTGTERTGTVPFMAVALLEDMALQGKIKHAYEHDAESFIWVLIWISLRYASGKLRESKDGRPFDEWLRVDATQCRENKADFLHNEPRRPLQAGVGNERNWELAKQCIVALMQKELLVRTLQDPLQALDVDTAFDKLLKGPVDPYL